MSDIDRRNYLKTIGALAGGLVVGGAAGWLGKPMEKIIETVTETVTLKETVSTYDYGLEVKKFPGVTLNQPTGAGWRCIAPVKNRMYDLKAMTGIDVTWDEVTMSELQPKILLNFQQKTGAYDIVEFANRGNCNAYRQYLMPLNEYIENDFGSIDEFYKRFTKSTVDVMTFEEDGESNIYAIPFHVNMMTWGHSVKQFTENNDAFKAQYGRDLARPKNYDEVLDIAEFFNKPEEDKWGFAFIGKAHRAMLVIQDFLFYAGIDYLDPETNRFAAPKSKVIEAMRFPIDCIYEYGVSPPETVALANPDINDMYIKGNTGIVKNWWGDFWDTIRDPDVIKVVGQTDNYIVYSDPENGKSFVSVWAYGIPKDSRNPDAAWEFIKWATQDRIQLAQSEESGQSSPIRDVNELAVQLNYVPRGIADNIDRAYQSYYNNFEFAPELWAAMWPIAGELFAGTIDLDEWYEKTASTVNTIMEDHGC